MPPRLSRPAKFAVSLLLVAVAAGAAARLRQRWLRSDEDTDPEEAIERAEAQMAAAGGGCGIERWSVKTLADSNAGSVNFEAADASVDSLASSPQGSPWAMFATGLGGGAHQMPPDVRTLSGQYAENQVYRIHANLVRYKLETDSDYHIVVADPQTGATIIVEATAPKCAQGSAKLGDIQNARGQFDSTFGAPGPQFTEAGNVPVTIKGVRFFDHLHNQNGVAQNGVELHPILCISRGSDCDN